MVVEEEVAGGFAGLDGESGEGVIFCVELEHAEEIDGADDVHVVEEEGFVETGGIFEEKPGGFFQAATSVEQEFFAGDFNAHAELFVGFQVVNDHVGEVVDVDDDFSDAEGAQAREGDFEEGATGEFDERFGAIVGERAEAGAEAGGEDHGFHWEAFILESEGPERFLHSGTAKCAVPPVEMVGVGTRFFENLKVCPPARLRRRPLQR